MVEHRTRCADWTAPTGQLSSHLRQRVQSSWRASTGRAVVQPRSRLPSHVGSLNAMSRAGSAKSSGARSRQSAPTTSTSAASRGPSPLRRRPCSCRPRRDESPAIEAGDDVECDAVGRCEDRADVPRRAAGGPVAFHAHDRVHDRERRLAREKQVHQHAAEVVAIGDFEVVLRFLQPGDAAEQVLHGAGEHHEAMRLELGQRDQHVGLGDDSPSVKAPYRRLPSHGHANAVVIEEHEVARLLRRRPRRFRCRPRVA